MLGTIVHCGLLKSKWSMTVQWGCGHHFSVSNGEFLSVRLFQLKRRPSNKPLDKYERRRSPPQFCVDRFSRQVSHRINWAVAYCRVSSNCLQGSFKLKTEDFSSIPNALYLIRNVVLLQEVTQLPVVFRKRKWVRSEEDGPVF